MQANHFFRCVNIAPCVRIVVASVDFVTQKNRGGWIGKIPRYSAERKASVLKKLLPLHNRLISEVAKEEGISEVTLYNWRTKVKEQGLPVLIIARKVAPEFVTLWM
jgi:hypothetical protein